jgi:phytoene dehydrogenase-like protein
VVDIVAEYAPGIKSLILHRQVLTPLDLERDFGLTEGNIFQGELAPDQLFFMRPLAGWRRSTRPRSKTCGCADRPHIRGAESWARRAATPRGRFSGLAPGFS